MNKMIIMKMIFNILNKSTDMAKEKKINKANQRPEATINLDMHKGLPVN